MEKTIKSKNPYNSEILGYTKFVSNDELNKIIKRLRINQVELLKIPLAKRKEMIKEFIKLFRRHGDELAVLFSSETGIVVKESIPSTEKIIERLDYILKVSDKVLEPKIDSIDDQTQNVLLKYPYGVVGIISTWNYLYVPLVMFVSAFLAGNCVVLKPSEYSTITMVKLMSLMEKVGLSKYIQFIYGDSSIGIDLIKSDIDSIAFVGRTETGRDIMDLASKKLIPVMLGLSGKDAMVILNDVDIKEVAKETIIGGFRNNGESCASVEIIYVHEDIYSEFLKEMENELKTLKIGDPLKKDTDIGPIATEYDYVRIKSQIKDALKNGAKIVYQAKTNGMGKHQIFPPTLISNTKESMRIRIEEAFSPTIVIEKFKNVEEVVNEINSSQFGLSNSIWSKDIKKASEIAGRINVGLSCVNCLPRSFAQYPWGGIKNSGFGKILSEYGFDPYIYIRNLRIKTI